MPAPKYRQQTALSPFSLVGAGFRGLNTEIKTLAGLVDTTWALDLQNVVWGTSGLLETRKGWIDQTETPITSLPDLYVVHEYVRADETTSLIAVTSAFGFWVSTDDGATWSAITGSVSTTTVRWKFVNFQDEVYAAAPGHKVHRYTGSGNLTEIAASPVTNGVILAAFGRIWVGVDASDSSRITYSGLLDGTDWVSTSSGTIDASNAWTQGRDNVQGLAAFGATFVVFGRRHILIYVDGAGSELGVDPDNMYVVDTIEGTGLADRSRDTVVNIGEGDLWFQGPKGIQSLARVIADKTNPLVDVSANVASLITDLRSEQIGAEGNAQAVYSAANDFILLLYPESEIIVMFDTAAGPMEDGTFRAAEWRGLSFYSLCVRQNGDILFGLGAGNVARYEGYRDDGNAETPIEYSMVFGSPWLDGGEQAHSREKIMKNAKVQLVGRETLTGTLRWGFDFRPLEYSVALSSDYIASGDEYAIGEYSEAEYGEGHRSRSEHLPLGGQGQFVKLHLTVKSDDVDAKVALQEVTAYAKLGRMT